MAVYGEVSTQKSEDDVGFALIYKPLEYWENRLFYTATDFSRNQRNELSDRFQKTCEFWICLTLDKTQEFFEWAIRSDKQSQWFFPDQNKLHIYTKNYLGFKSRNKVFDHKYLNFQLSLTERYEEIVENVEFLKGEYQFQLEGWSFWQGQWLFGIQYVDRIWRQNMGEVRHKNLLPHLWWKKMNWQLGYETTLFSAKGPSGLRSGLDTKSFKSEHRLNIGYEYKFDKASWRWLFTFDVDRLGSSESWEGGSAQLITWF